MNKTCPATGPVIDGSAALTTGNTSEVARAKNPDRKWLYIGAVDDDFWVDFDKAAVKDIPSIKVANGTALVFTTWIPQGAVNIIGATTGKKYIVKEGV